MNHPYPFERRRHERHAISRPCKVYHAGSARYLPASTRDLSDAGALLAIDSPRDLEVGDALTLHVAWDDRALLSDSGRIEARVTRVLRTNSPRQFVGVAFDVARAIPRRVAA